jgi:O-antigen/teichoic acid export membrane protein
MSIVSTIATIRQQIQKRFPKGSLRGRLASGTFWVTVGTALARVSGLLAAIIVANMLGKGTYGELGIILQSLTMFSSYASLRLAMIASRYVAELRAGDPQRAGRIIGLATVTAMISGAAVSLFVVVAAPWVAVWLKAPHLANLLRVSAIGIFFSALSGSQIGTLTGLEAFRTSAKAELMRSLATLPVILILTLFFGLTGAVWGYTLIIVIGWGITNVLVRRELSRFGIQWSLRGCGRELPVLWSFGLPSFLGGLMLWPMQWLGCAIIAKQPGGYDSVGVYTAAKQWWVFLMFLPQMLSQVVVPIYTERFAHGDRKSVHKVLAATVATVAVLTLPVALGVSLLSGWIMRLYGPAFAGEGSVLVLVVWGAVFCSLQYPASQVLVATARMWVHFGTSICLSGAFLGTIWLLRDMGAMALGWGTLVGYGVHSMCNFGLAWWLTRRSARQDSPDLKQAAPVGETA